MGWFHSEKDATGNYIEIVGGFLSRTINRERILGGLLKAARQGILLGLLDLLIRIL